MKHCRLCEAVAHKNIHKPWNLPLFETENFIVVPSLGALVEGWLLLVPRTHVICYGQISCELDGELAELKSFIQRMLRSIYGPVAVFEHGPAYARSDIGCGVDHAHLHFVPFPDDVDLASLVTPYLPSGVYWKIATVNSYSESFVRHKEYLYIEQQDRQPQIAIGNGFISQTFRRAISTVVGSRVEWNWREFPRFDVVDATINRIEIWRDKKFECQPTKRMAA